MKKTQTLESLLLSLSLSLSLCVCESLVSIAGNSWRRFVSQLVRVDARSCRLIRCNRLDTELLHSELLFLDDFDIARSELLDR